MSTLPGSETMGLKDIISAYDGLILDLFGVLHNGIEPLPNALEALEQLRANGKRTCLLSNSPRRSGEVAARLRTMGIDPELYDGLITSGELVFAAFAATSPCEAPVPGSRFLHIGPQYLSGLLNGLALERVAKVGEANFVLVTGAPEPEGDASLLFEARQYGLPLICANPDLTVMIGDQNIPCAGTVAAEYEAMGGKIHYFGKPWLHAYEEALMVLRLPPSRVLAVGDSLATDICGANGAGVDFGLSADRHSSSR